MPKIPANDFRPSPGPVREVAWPAGDGIRVDTHIAAGSRVPPFYDSLMAKIIAHAPDRAAALARLRQALAATRLAGVRDQSAVPRSACSPTRNSRPAASTRASCALLERGRDSGA